jgi:hypothetical protein
MNVRGMVLAVLLPLYAQQFTQEQHKKYLLRSLFSAYQEFSQSAPVKALPERAYRDEDLKVVYLEAAKSIREYRSVLTNDLASKLLVELGKHDIQGPRKNGEPGIFMSAIIDSMSDQELSFKENYLDRFGAFSIRNKVTIAHNFGNEAFYMSTGSDVNIKVNSGECAYMSATGRNLRIGKQTHNGGYHNNNDIRTEGVAHNICVHCRDWKPSVLKEHAHHK